MVPSTCSDSAPGLITVAHILGAITPLPLRTLCSLVSDPGFQSHSFNFLPSVTGSPKSCCFLDLCPKPPEQSFL